MDHWKEVLRRHWGITAELTQLDGEFDLNFLVETATGAGFVLKAMRPDCPAWLVEMQIGAMTHIAARDPDVPVPRVITSLNGEDVLTLKDETGAARLVWLIARLPGRVYAQVTPKTVSLMRQLGVALGRTARAMADFSHARLERDFKWDLMRAHWIAGHLDAFADPQRKTLLESDLAAFEAIRPVLDALPKQAIHNDANDYNILVAGDPGDLRVTGLIDFGDMCTGPRICDLAIAAAYVVLDQPQPDRTLQALVAGYHAVFPLTGPELDLLWPLVRARLAVSVVNSQLMSLETPDDPYVVISQAPAWRFLEGFPAIPDLLSARLRAACGHPVSDAAGRALDWLETARGGFAPILGVDISDAPLRALSVEASACPQDPFDMTAAEAALLGEESGAAEEIWLGYYLEPRLIYTAPAFRLGPWKASNRRTVHLAVDVFAPAGTALHAPLDGEIAAIENRTGNLDYGGVIVLRHVTPDGDAFHTLYGHLDPACLDTLKPGDKVKRGAVFCHLGDRHQNGGWAPHLHLQLALTIDGIGDDWPGVCDPDDIALWEAVCPNPAALLNLPDASVRYAPTDRTTVLEKRRAHFGGNLSLTYAEPVMLVRGWKHYLFDEWGRPYLDAYNNVPHVGHAHPRIQAVAADQLRRVNTNTRYLHPAQTAFADALLSRLPGHLEVCFFVNSGSEANELALRLARAHTGAKGMVTPDHGYHGNTTGAVAISAYKFNKPGGVGKTDWVELVEVADDYRGSFRRDDPDRARKYADLVDPAIAALTLREQGVAGFIAETFPSVGGQIIPPTGYLPAVYDKIRAAGGICIADEVQTGLGRLGKHYFGFEQQGASPDVVVLGKPIGNGHPIGVVITTREIAESFDNGIEFFSTFGGSTLSCRIGSEVLQIIEDEGLQENAQRAGAQLLQGLRALELQYDCIGDVRGMGLFIGVELVRSDGSEATELCTFVKNRMRDRRILIGSEGPYDNILKIRPPLTIGSDDIDMIVTTLDGVLAEAAQ
ncbi:aminotransferase class III-fold pyridoxal phosphate-dependent enzyme [Sulfitobacter sp. TSTF-M16]|uniref:Aminotransferase class III-fold pyridoxal phosphate-dependent enzyme n=1 Tax=Sulfitobacter aestuariivivens TaxID=2766981 RepID=A0A927D5Z5_9RHOB|nr:aminotransferase class III-fold pyridoxal phosphate-dependent enzyme [Sulfitobacter aestuariivivens]MBD3664097.1 aminotransferase class III-fold pyridoxal phosphate-dependent enzyme [Sulfitobacter aestuariivivens]